MRVAIVSESFLPTINGVTNSVQKVLEYLRDNGHHATVIAPAAGAPDMYAGFVVHEVPAIAYRQFPVGIPNPLVQRLISDFRPDVIHAAAPFLLGTQAIAAGRRLGIPSVAVFQTDVAGYARRNNLGAATRFAWRVVRKVHEGAEITLAPSTASMTDLRGAGLDRLAHWGRGVDLNAYHPRNRNSRMAEQLRRAFAPRGETVIGYVGRLAPEKQVERIAALRGIENVRFAIVGDGPSRPSLERQLRGMPITWLGSLRDAQLSAAYASLDIFAHTGSEETFGQTIQEAHASGIPVIAPRAGGPIDLIDHGTTGYLYDPADDQEFRAYAESLSSDEPLRSRMGEAGRRAVLPNSWDSLGAELLEHYRGAIMARSLAAATRS
ncbi:MAG: glycosyltransferase family 1 protein [Salinibacterium sp.]|nr:MAG: glycosyltransferase family 1 protein [Salinibacterium sp.]